MFKSPALWALLGAIVLGLLQLSPFPGAILMMFGAGLITAILVHVFLISLFIEAAIGRAPRVLMVVPLAAYGAYYVVYFQEGREIAERAAQLREINPGKLLDFDPERDALVGTDLTNLVQTHEIPVVYEPQPSVKPEGYYSYRLVRSDQCRALGRDSQNRIVTMGVFGKHRLPICVLRFPDKPEGRIVTVSKVNDAEVWKRNPGLTEQITDLLVDGKVIGSYRGAAAWRLPAFPIGFVGCALNSAAPAWQCAATFMRDFQSVDTVPNSVDKTKFDSPASVMLGLRKYSDGDLANFKGFALNEPALARMADEPRRVQDHVFATLERILDGEPVAPTFNMGYSLSLNPERLGPHAERLVARLDKLWDTPLTGDRRETDRALATAASVLPPSDFQKIADAALALVQRPDAAQRFPALYLRAADAGPKAFDFYKRAFLAEGKATFDRSLPVLAICRIGEADPETINEMKRRFQATESDYRNSFYKGSLFVNSSEAWRGGVPARQAAISKRQRMGGGVARWPRAHSGRAQ